MADEESLRRQGLWDYERDQPLRRNRPVPDETLSHEKPPIPLASNLVSGLTKLGNAEGEAWVTLREAEAAAVCAELSKLHAEHLQDVERMDKAATAMEAYQSEIKRLTTVETPAPQRYNIVATDRGTIITRRAPNGEWVRYEDIALCEGCPPVGYPTEKTRCLPCPRRAHDEMEADPPLWKCPFCSHWNDAEDRECDFCPDGRQPEKPAPQCGCHETYPQLQAGSISHAPGCRATVKTSAPQTVVPDDVAAQAENPPGCGQ